MSGFKGTVEHFTIGAFGVGVGALLIWFSVTDPGSVNGPAWILAAVGCAFAAAGVAGAAQGSLPGHWVGPLALLVMVGGVASVVTWIAFGPGPRACGGGIGLPFVSFGRGVGETECRAAFGFAAFMLDGGAIALMAGGFAQWFPDNPAVPTIQAVGRLALLLGFLPLILLGLVWVGATQGVEAMGGRFRRFLGR